MRGSTKCLKILYLICRYRLFFLFGFVPYLGFFKIFLNPHSKKQALRFKDFLENTGPCFVKLGQIFSVRSDLIGKTFADALSTLREDGKKSTNKHIKAKIKEAFGSNYLDYNEFVLKNKQFSSPTDNIASNRKIDIFNENNLKLVAIGSISEVYKLQLNHKQAIAIKVLKPKIRKHFREDIVFLRKVFNFVQNNVKEANRTKILKIVDLLDKISIFELDLKFEAAALTENKINFKDLDLLYTPKVYWRYCTKNVLVVEWIDGCKIYDLICLKSNNINTKLVLVNLIKIFFYQVFKFGFFHGDLHPGNIIVTPNGKLSFVDYGIMGRVSLDNKKYIYEVWKAFLNQDYKVAAKVHFKAGWVSKTNDIDDLALAIRSIVDPVFSFNENTFSIGKLIEQLFEVTRLFGMEIQRELLLIQKNMLLLEGISRMLVPEVNIWSMAKNVINLNEFNITVDDKVNHVKSFLQNKIKENIYSVAEIFAFANYNVKQKLYSQNNLEKKHTSYKLIIMLLIIIITLLLLK